MVRTIAFFRVFDDDKDDYVRSESPELMESANGSKYICFRSQAEKVEGVKYPSANHFVFAEDSEDEKFVGNLEIGDKVAVRK